MVEMRSSLKISFINCWALSKYFLSHCSGLVGEMVGSRVDG